MHFRDLRLIEPILRALVSEGYSSATPIQAKAIPPALAGRDVLGCAQTGTGKTAAFALPIIQQLSLKHLQNGAQKNRLRCLVLCPTRELATQIGEGFGAYGKNLSLRHTVIFGGVGQNPQVDALRRGTDILIATPGRLLDLLNQGCCDLRSIEVLVLDEADRMLDMGFIRDIRKIVQQLPANRQTMLFSATMPAEIRQLANSMLRNPAIVQVAPVASPIEAIDQSVYFVEKRNKPQLLAHLVNELPMSRAIVFTRTKHGADKVVRHLHTRGIKAEAIHGNKSQNNRQRALANFKSSRIPVLVATDIASRGIDIDDVSHVVNYDLTHEPETYVHRIGRTARAGASGVAIAFCDQEERENLRAIEKLIRQTIPVREDHPTYSAAPTKPVMSPASHAGSGHPPRQSDAQPHSHSQARSGSHSHKPHSHKPHQRSDSGSSNSNSGSRRHSSQGHRHPQTNAQRHQHQSNASHGHPHQAKGAHGHPQRGSSSRSTACSAGRGAPRSHFKGKPRRRRAF